MFDIFIYSVKTGCTAVSYTMTRLTVLAAGAVFMASAVAQTPGSLDLSFAAPVGRIASLDVGPSSDSATAVALQADGKILLAGNCAVGAFSYFCAVRLNADGTGDSQFSATGASGDGKVLTDVRGAAAAIALQADGKVLLGGAQGQTLCVLRLNANGTKDSGFGNNGAACVDVTFNAVGASATVSSLAIQSDGKVVIAGYCRTSIDLFCIARFDGNGVLDKSFLQYGGNVLSVGNSNGNAYALALQTDGKIIMAGGCVLPSAGGAPSFDFCATRLNLDGSFDTTFASSGKFFQAIGPGADNAYAAALQPDGKLVLAGSCWNGSNNDFCLARVNTDGTLDTSLAPNSALGAGRLLLPMGSLADEARAVAVQGDGKILIGGYCSNGIDNVFCMARVNSDGSLDTTFGTLGKLMLPLGNNTTNNQASGLALQRDGKSLIIGTCNDASAGKTFCVARLNGGPYGARNCSMDIDGDGQLLATVDGLIATRLMLGLRGSTVVAGINFPIEATRNTWPLIRNYLLTQCQMSVD